MSGQPSATAPAAALSRVLALILAGLAAAGLLAAAVNTALLRRPRRSLHALARPLNLAIAAATVVGVSALPTDAAIIQSSADVARFLDRGRVAAANGLVAFRSTNEGQVGFASGVVLQGIDGVADARFGTVPSEDGYASFAGYGRFARVGNVSEIQTGDAYAWTMPITSTLLYSAAYAAARFDNTENPSENANAYKGDSGGPVSVDGRLVGIMAAGSLRTFIDDPFGRTYFTRLDTPEILNWIAGHTSAGGAWVLTAAHVVRGEIARTGSIDAASVVLGANAFAPDREFDILEAVVYPTYEGQDGTTQDRMHPDLALLRVSPVPEPATAGLLAAAAAASSLRRRRRRYCRPAFGVLLVTAAATLVAPPARGIVVHDPGHGASPEEYVAHGASPQFQATGFIEANDANGLSGVTGSLTLIDRHWALTAAHVLRQGDEARTPAAVGFGPNEITDRGRTYVPDQWFVHPQWNPYGEQWWDSDTPSPDVALLHFADPIIDVAPAPLFAGTLRKGIGFSGGDVVHLVGYGRTGTASSGPTTFDGQKRGALGPVRGLDRGAGGDYVTTIFGPDPSWSWYYERLGGNGGPGDSGGSAYIDVAGEMELAGVISYAPLGGGQYLGHSGFFELAPYTGWIQSTMASVPEPAAAGLLAAGGIVARLRRRRVRA